VIIADSGVTTGRTPPRQNLNREGFAAILSDAEELWRYHAVSSPLQKSDVLIGLGSYDLRVADRVADLFFEGIADLVVLSGAWGNWTRGTWDVTEAEMFGVRLAARGVPERQILLERAATNLGENVSLCRKLLADRELSTVTFVTKPQTQRRALATAQQNWPGVSHRVAAPPLDLWSQSSVRGLAELIDEMVGDVDRLRFYGDLGFQVPVEVPDQVLAAQARLIAAGFDGHRLDRGLRPDRERPVEPTGV
jgi:uncharacterized SAM-binding protein YcdF (DUF218 family)